MSTEKELAEARRTNARTLGAESKDFFPNQFRVSPEMEDSRKRAVAIALSEEERSKLAHEVDLQGNEEIHWLFGRVIARRGPFVVVRTPYGDCQALARDKSKDPALQVLGGQDAVALQQVDLADHVAIQGPLIRTKSGDAAVRANRFLHVGKAFLPPPDKWHGLTDVEKRYRERYVDLFTNPEVAQVFRARSMVVKFLRRFFDDRDFMEVETPLLHPLRGGATAKPFDTHHNALDQKFYLRIAPELYLKRLLVGGFDRVYEIGRCFRNEGVSTRHNPEFTMLEFYMAYATFEEIMNLNEELLRFVDQELRKNFDREGAPFEASRKWWQERAFTFDEPFVRVDMRDAIVDRLKRSGETTPVGELAKTHFDGLLSREQLNDAAYVEKTCAEVNEKLTSDERRYLKKCRGLGERIFALYEILVEPDLAKLYRSKDGSKSLPVFVMKHPFEISPLARKSDDEPAVTDRFELFVEGREICNAFSELNDPDDQASRFKGQLVNRESGDDEAMDYDADYIRALMHGMPPAAGFGLGVDRLAMLLCNQPSIRDVLLFPALRHEPATLDE